MNVVAFYVLRIKIDCRVGEDGYWIHRLPRWANSKVLHLVLQTI